ncbi:hypothetical protein BJ878DRAFT_541235 [Calycina marina]|uniref:Uncharacterized protein n=1 Tax=Calycina marina TaxID=1763456 RepID=A0A9P7Z560_9HELO|nr:hypothetical protein BJ878DRAFT_541235 [Calycina marina]
MSDSTFEEHMTHLHGIFKRSDDLCITILEHRRAGRKHEALDHLRLGLNTSRQEIQIQYSNLLKVFGSKFDLGDDIARESVYSSIRSMENISRKIFDIADRRNEGAPGFKDMLKTVQYIEDRVADTLTSLGQRLDHPPEPVEEKAEEKKKKERKQKKADEIVVSIKEWDRYIEHLKNSWSESWLAGRILYINAFEESQNTWDRPRRGFIKTLPVAVPKSTPTPVF